MSTPEDVRLRELTIERGQSIRGAMHCIERNELRIALMVDASGRLLGTVSDGDLRRALLAGAALDDLVDPFASDRPVTVEQDTDRAAVLDLMKARNLGQIPVIDREGRLLGIHVLQELLGSHPKPNHAVVLAGGRGTRLGGLTASVPKPMLPVAGRPILERLVLHLVGSGIRHIHLSVSYLAEQIREHFGDGSDHGCSISYLPESPDQPLGTGGPLRLLLPDQKSLASPLLVLNGDLVASFSVHGILESHARQGASMTVALREYAHDVPFGVATLDADNPEFITALDEKPRWAGQVNAGIYVVEPYLIEQIPAQVNYPITDLVQTSLERGERIVGWRLVGEWHDVGQPYDLARARGEV